MGEDVEGYFWVLDVVRGQWDTAERRKRMGQVAQMDGYDVPIGFEHEGGSSGKDVAFDTVRQYAGYSIFPEHPTGSKEARATPFSIQVNNGNVRLQQASWNREYLEELQVFPLGKNDDQVDSSSGAFRMLTQRNIVQLTTEDIQWG